MHADLVARMSKPLWTLVNGEFEEAKQNLAEWPDFDEGTFIRFCEFAYTGDYKAAEPCARAPTPPRLENSTLLLMKGPPKEPPEEPPEVPVPESAESFDDWGVWGTATKKSKKRNKGFSFEPPIPEDLAKDEMWQRFELAVGDEPNKKQKEERNACPFYNYSEVLLSHAHLYVLADYYAIDELMGLCVRKLHRTLKIFNLHGGERVTDIAQLIDYSYKNTLSKEGKPDKLRELLATYVACKIEELWPNVYFQDVLESGEISKVIIGKLLMRLK